MSGRGWAGESLPSLSPTGPVQKLGVRPDDQVGSPEGRRAVSPLRLEAVERIHIPAERAAWEQSARGRRGPALPPKRKPRERLVEALLAGTDPETCEVEMLLDDHGLLVAVVIRDLASGALLARVDPAELASFEAAAGDGGILLERRG